MAPSVEERPRTISPTLADLMADPGELDVSCLDCRHNTTVPVAALLPAAPCGRRLSRSELYQIFPDMVISSSGWRGAPALELAGLLRVAGRPEPEPVTVSRARAGVRLFEQSDVGTARPGLDARFQQWRWSCSTG